MPRRKPLPSESPLYCTPREAAALDRLLDAYVVTEEGDPGIEDLRSLRLKVIGISQDHTKYATWQREPTPARTQPAQSDAGAPWTHGTRLGRDHRSVRQHLVEDHGVSQAQADAWSDGAVHGHHDGVHRDTWAYAHDLVHPAPGDREYLAKPA